MRDSEIGSTQTDVAVLGGGLAGLTLAIQLKRQDPDIAVTVLERRAHPVREAAFKVGESTVEIGAQYFADVLGLRAHLDEAQIHKFGFRFFFNDGGMPIDACTEVGVSQRLPTPSWQIDRGRFENFLGEHARALGVDFRDGASVRGIDLADDDAPHRVRFEHNGEAAQIAARWVVDASGRAGLLKRKLELAQSNDHNVNAIWWRVDGIVDPAAWSNDAAWQNRCMPPERWRSTNHLCGEGYWLWMIPLASGAHSLGIVAEESRHPLESLNSYEKTLHWLDAHQPQLAQALRQPQHGLKDFLFLRHFSYGCRQVFSPRRWALTGEAGVFLDPFYSPGSDFIAISNGYICDLIGKDRAGQAFAPYAEIYQQLYFSFYENTMPLYQDQYDLFGDAQVMPIKVIWDYTYYWSLLAPLYFPGKLLDLAFLQRLRPQFDTARELNLAMQPLLREWGRRNAGDGRASSARPDMLDQYNIAWFHEMNRSLSDALDDAAFARRIADNVTRMRQLAAEILQRARAAHPALDSPALQRLVPAEAAGDPLLPAAWYGQAA